MRQKKDILKLQQTISDLLATQKLAVLSSFGRGQPYASLMAFVATDCPVSPGSHEQQS